MRECLQCIQFRSCRRTIPQRTNPGSIHESQLQRQHPSLAYRPRQADTDPRYRAETGPGGIAIARSRRRIQLAGRRVVLNPTSGLSICSGR